MDFAAFPAFIISGYLQDDKKNFLPRFKTLQQQYIMYFCTSFYCKIYSFTQLNTLKCQIN
jgi:hypothetical protein